ncbi:MAG: hypothetical protein V1855_04910 [bacterium]
MRKNVIRIMFVFVVACFCDQAYSFSFWGWWKKDQPVEKRVGEWKRKERVQSPENTETVMWSKKDQVRQKEHDREVAWMKEKLKKSPADAIQRDQVRQPKEEKVEARGEVFLKKHDMKMSLGGRFKDEFFYYDRVRTLRNDFYDQNEFFRHRLDLNMSFQHGAKKYGRPAMEGFVELTNYVFWQNNSVYFPMYIDEIKSEEMDVTLAKQVTVKPLVPLLFLSEGWFKVNIDTLSKRFLTGGNTYLKIGLFKYDVGRGISLGTHDDLAIDYLGWGGEGGFEKFRSSPPGILFSSKLYKDLTFDLYYMKWREVDAGENDTLAPVYGHLLDPNRDPARGRRQDTDNIAVKLIYEPTKAIHVEPYYIYTRAPEQTIEMTGDASSYISTLGCMTDWNYKNWNINVEVAGQFGHQQVHAIDRNTKILTRSGTTGAATTVFSHVVYDKANYRFGNVPVTRAVAEDVPADSFSPEKFLEYVVDLPRNRAIERQGEGITTERGTPKGMFKDSADTLIRNANFFGNPRFRDGYKLNYRGFMALLDISYEFDKYPFKIAGAAGYISGDNYPHNEEKSRSYNGFVPLRSRYKGRAVQSLLIFDRQVIPRPLNIAYRTLYAYNNRRDLSNLQFLGGSLTWAPLSDKQKMSVTSDVIIFWEDAQLKKWDKEGKHSDPEVEKYLVLKRAELGFPGVKREVLNLSSPDSSNKGWLSNDDASKFLGTEINLKVRYQVVDDCDFYAKGAVFLPGQLYKDLDGQPNEKTRRINAQRLVEYEGLGHQTAFGFVVGFNYRF